VRAGYLAVLASRALGTVPTLRPLTPSRFEPTGGQAGLREMVEVVETIEGMPTTARPAFPAQAEPASARRDEDRPLVGQWPPAHDDPRVVATADPRRSARFDGPQDPPRLADPPPRPDRHSDWGPPEVAELVRLASAPDVVGGRSEAWPAPDRSEPAMVTRSARTPGREVTQGTSGPWGATSAPVPAHNQVDQPSPTVVVRIGRVDVRAVQAAPAQAPPPASRPDPPAGPSLAEHLAARDAARR
jgi:hypothetical protein